MKKIIIFGCQQITIDIMTFLSQQQDVKILLVVAYEVISDISRGQKSVIDVACSLNLNIISPPYISSEIIQQVIKLKPDLIISSYYRKILPKQLISVPKQGTINIHPSLLPYYRGPVPTAWAILNGEKSFGVTIHKIDSGIDTGDILLQKSFVIDDEETGYELYLRAMKIGADMLIQNFDDIVNGAIEAKKQDRGGSYYGKIDNKFFLDWRNKAESIRNQVRVRAKPYNPVETILMSKYIFINKVSIYNNDDYIVQKPGFIVNILNNDRIVVSCADGALVLEDYDVYPLADPSEKEIIFDVGRKFSNKP